MAIIINVIDTNHVFGYGQKDHNTKGYYLDSDGGILGNVLFGMRKSDAIIETDCFNIEIICHGKFILRIVDKKGWIIGVEKTLLNTASPEYCVAVAEEQLRIINGNYSTLLERRRKAAQLTRAELSEMSGVHPQLIAKYETNERDITKAQYGTICKLAAALQCKPENIVDKI